MYMKNFKKHHVEVVPQSRSARIKESIAERAFTFGCKAITANAKARIMVITMKNTFSPQSCPEGLNHINKIPEKTNVAM